MSARPRMHGVAHIAGGPDPIPTNILAAWAGSIPVGLGPGIVWRIPYDATGGTLAFTIRRAFARVETAAAATTTFRFEKSPGGTAAFTPTTITSLSISTGGYEANTTGLAVPVVSGDLVRVVFVAGAAGAAFGAQLVGAQS